jgi:hypothetical protein
VASAPARPTLKVSAAIRKSLNRESSGGLKTAAVFGETLDSGCSNGITEPYNVSMLVLRINPLDDGRHFASNLFRVASAGDSPRLRRERWHRAVMI